MDLYYTEVSKELFQLGESGVIPSAEYRITANALAEEVKLVLQHTGKDNDFSVSKTHIGGSYGKKTSCQNPDLDIVILLNNIQPPVNPALQEALKKFEEALKLNRKRLQIKKNSIERKENSIYFQFTCGIEVDLLAGVDLPTGNLKEWIEAYPENIYKLNISFVAEQLKFMKSFESSFVHVCVRLLKYCFISLGYEYTGILLELVGVAAAEEVEWNPRNEETRSIVGFLRKALYLLAHIRTLRLVFKQLPAGKWTRAKPVHNGMVPKLIGSMDIRNKERFILVPPNTMCDLLENKDDHFFRRHISFARVMRRRLMNALEGKYRNKEGGLCLNLMLKRSKSPYADADDDAEE